MADEIEPIDGGKVGVPQKLLLDRSEMLVMRRMADKYPIVEGERREAVELLMDTMRRTKSPRTRISAIKTLAALDVVNQHELKAYLDGSKEPQSKGGVVQVNVQIVEQMVVKKEEEPPKIIECLVDSPNGKH